jgi:putative oxidoreductase
MSFLKMKRRYLPDKKKSMQAAQTRTHNVLLLLIRIWLGYRMFTASYSSVTDILFHPNERAFFIKWFGEELHFPMPLAMAFLAKGSELLGGILVLLGFFTRAAAFLIAFTMLVATLTANLGENWNIDGGFTVSNMLFALVLIVEGAGKYSIEYLVWKKKKSKGLSSLS